MAWLGGCVYDYIRFYVFNQCENTFAIANVYFVVNKVLKVL